MLDAGYTRCSDPLFDARFVHDSDQIWADQCFNIHGLIPTPILVKKLLDCLDES